MAFVGYVVRNFMINIFGSIRSFGIGPSYDEFLFFLIIGAFFLTSEFFLLFGDSFLIFVLRLGIGNHQAIAGNSKARNSQIEGNGLRGVNRMSRSRRKACINDNSDEIFACTIS